MKSKPEKHSPLKDKPLRYAGQSLDDEIYNRLMDLIYWILMPCMLFVIAIGDWIHYFYPKPTNPILSTIIALIITSWGAYKVFKGKKEIDRLKMARDGEKLVAEGLLEMIKQGATVLNDIQSDKFNIDHVVVSKHGVYLIETKTFSKPVKKEAKITFDAENVYVNGKIIERNPITQIKALSNWLQNLLKESTGIKFKIHPVILFPGWFTEKMKGGEDFWILNPKALPSFISHEPISLKDTEVHLVAFHLSRYVRTFTPKEGK